MAAISSMRLFVVIFPARNLLLNCPYMRTAPQPPGPGLPLHAPSVYITTFFNVSSLKIKLTLSPYRCYNHQGFTPKGHGVMVTRGSPKPLLRVRVLLPLPISSGFCLRRFFIVLIHKLYNIVMQVVIRYAAYFFIRESYPLEFVKRFGTSLQFFISTGYAFMPSKSEPRHTCSGPANPAMWAICCAISRTEASPVFTSCPG